MKTCIASGTLKEITPSEIATPSMIDTQEKIVRETLKKTIRQKMKTTTKTRDSKKSRGTVAVIFVGVPDSKSKHQEKLAL